MMKGDDEGMVSSCKNLLLRESSLDLFALDHFFFRKNFHCKQLPRLLLSDQVDLADITFTQEFDFDET